MADHLTVDIDSDEGDYTDYATDAGLPTPSGTPYRTPHPSRHPSRHATPSPTPSPYPPSSSPPTTNGRGSPLHRLNIGHQQHHHLHHQDRSFDETISLLDPRRFTPTLHANLVAEILSLRRELESKSNLVDTLEQDLHAARNEHETAATSAVTAQREARDIKRQLARAENDDAVEAVAKERDDAVDAVAELKRQVERLTKSRRSAEEDFDRLKKMAEDDHEQQEASKRVLERRAHVAEGRLKALLDELAAANAMPPPPPPPPVQDTPETDHEDAASDAASVRDSIRDSFKGRPASLMMGDDEAERLGIRFSVVAGSKGLSLADELNFDEEDEDYLEEEGEEEEEDDGDRTEAEFSFADDNASERFGEYNASDSGRESEIGEDDDEGACEMTEYHEMGVQVDFDDEIQEEQEQEQEQEQEPDQEQHQSHHESEQQSERLDVLGLEIEEKLAELERTYVELDRKTVELDSIYGEFDKVHERVAELEEQIEKMEEEAAGREEAFGNRENDHVQLRSDHAQLETDHAQLKVSHTQLETDHAQLKSNHKQLETDHTQLKTNHKQLETDHAQMKVVHTQLETDHAQLKADHTQLGGDHAQLRSDHTQLESDHAQLKIDYAGQAELLEIGGKDVDERLSTLQAQEVILQTQEMSLQTRQVSLDGVEKALGKRSKDLDEQEKHLDEREALIIAASTPIITEDEEFMKDNDDPTPAETEAKEREGEYEANERRKRSRSTGVSSPTPYSPISTSTATYVSVESQTSLVYVSVESQTNPPYVSIEAQTNPPYVSVEVQANPVYVSIDAQVDPVYVSIDSQVDPIYVSVESQTDEPPPPPPPPPRTPTPPPVIEVQTVGVQTDPMKPPPLPRIIPTIAVIPPPPTPPLPPQPKPIMKNAAVQTRSMPRAKSRGVQTEEMKFEEKILRLPPHLHPSAIMANNPLPPVPKPIDPIPSEDGPPPTPPQKNARRSMVKRTSAMGPTSVPVVPPRSAPSTVDAPPGSALICSSPPRVDNNYDGTPEKERDTVQRHLFNGVDFSHDLPQSSGDDDFHDDADLSGNEFKTALSAPKPKKSRNNPHINLSRPSPVEPVKKPAGGLQRKGATIRKNALITSGTQAHNRARSPSLTSNITNDSGGTKIGPPFPVPARHSSRKPSGYGNHNRVESPTPMSVGLPRRAMPPRHQRQPSVQSIQSIRKVRSATALPTLRTSIPRNRSPPPLSASSVAPDSPGLPPPLPRDEVVSPGYDKQKFGTSRHQHQESINTSNSSNTPGNASNTSLIQQTSVVDAIAQTMVGEWMWKYVRRRKSFGVTESPQNLDGRDESGGGQRHKRWVWLAPYERAVMWSSRQPTSGNALLGKSGRKRKRSILQPPAGISRALDKVLTNKVPIQSVLDVKDDTPLPKGADPSKPLFNRSILILTPARALKFTAPNRERHYVWLTALSFLSHSPQGSEGLLALPPPMPFEYEQVQHQQALAPPVQKPPMPPIPVHRDAPFHPVRDSIRLAKGKSRQSRQKQATFPPPRKDSIREAESIVSNGSVAEPPSIPRFPGQHTRKRSNSAVRPGTQRSISNEYHRNGYDPSVLSSYGGSSQGDFYGGGIVGGIGLVSGGSSMINGHPAPPIGGWDPGPMGTVRMEAFVERQPRYEFDEEDEYRRPSSYRLRRDRRSSRQESYWSGSGDFYAGSGPGPAVDDEGFWRGEDPFGGF